MQATLCQRPASWLVDGDPVGPIPIAQIVHRLGSPGPLLKRERLGTPLGVYIDFAQLGSNLIRWLPQAGSQSVAKLFTALRKASSDDAEEGGRVLHIHGGGGV